MSDDNDNLPVAAEPSALALLARAEIDVQISTAHAWPRSIARFQREALSMATLDEETAASCFYAVPRGGKTIEGPSVRLAEIVGSAWGNLRYGARIVTIGERHVTAQGVCHDLQNNVASTVEVQRRITSSNGRRYGDDMINTTCNAACAIALRNAIFKVVPFAYVKKVYQEARRVAIGDVKTLANKRAEMMAYFAKMGVQPERVLLAINKADLEDVGLGELLVLKGLATAIRDGDTTLEAAFPPPQAQVLPGQSRTEQLAGKLNGNGPKKPEAPAEQQSPPEPSIPASQGVERPEAPADFPEKAPAAQDAEPADDDARGLALWIQQKRMEIEAAETQNKFKSLNSELTHARLDLGEDVYRELNDRLQARWKASGKPVGAK